MKTGASRRFLVGFATVAVLRLLCACSSAKKPDAFYDEAYSTYLRGDLQKSEVAAANGFARFRTSAPAWAWKFRLLQVEIQVKASRSTEALALLRSIPEVDSSLTLEKLSWLAVLYGRFHEFHEAESALTQAQALCDANPQPSCRYVDRARGILSIEHGDYQQARQFFTRNLATGRASRDAYFEAAALLNLGACSLRQHHFDDAIQWLGRAHALAIEHGIGIIEQKALGNIGWAYYNLGDLEKSLALTLDAQQRATALGDPFDELAWTMNAGQVYAASGDASRAQASYQHALEQARKIGSKQDELDVLSALASLAEQTGQIEQARNYSDQAIASARSEKNHANELYPLLVRGLVEGHEHNPKDAETIFRSLEADPEADNALKWGATYGRAKLYQDAGRVHDAELAYQKALNTFESARGQLETEDYRLPFLSTALPVYDEYVRFLIGQGKIVPALLAADYSRAQTLAEGLGTHRQDRFIVPTFDPRTIAQKQRSTILFYWLGAKESYLWTITPRDVNLSRLPPAPDIDQQVQRHRKRLTGPLTPLEAGDTALYSTLLAPAERALRPSTRVMIVPDGSLNTLNFETLVAPDPKPHYWIEDATVRNAPSLRLHAVANSRLAAEELLLIGDAVIPDKEFAELPNAKSEMDQVSRHFSPSAELVLARDRATPTAYLENDPGRFTFIHFVTHGTASRLNPLDSAVVLSKTSPQDDSFKLYARDIVQHPLNAELVTISSCYGAGARTYSGEGLVGLSWAFLRAGAHNVIGALWEVSDASTPKLMDQMYDELAKGKPPDQALRDAKLALLHSDGVFRKPFYWAPFQLYAGS